MMKKVKKWKVSNAVQESSPAPQRFSLAGGAASTLNQGKKRLISSTALPTAAITSPRWRRRRSNPWRSRYPQTRSGSSAGPQGYNLAVLLCLPERSTGRDDHGGPQGLRFLTSR